MAFFTNLKVLNLKTRKFLNQKLFSVSLNIYKIVKKNRFGPKSPIFAHKNGCMMNFGKKDY